MWQRFDPRMNLLGDWDREGVVHLLLGLAALLSLVFVAAAFYLVPGLPVIGHDEVHYYQDFRFKLPEDGRWLNLLLHDFLRSIPPTLCAVLFLLLSWLLFYRLARGAAFGSAYAVVIASTILLASPFSEQVLWPATALPALVIMLGAGLLARRGVAHPIIYVLAGILSFGTLQTFYFLLPLWFLGRFLGTPQPGENRWRLLISHIGWWMAGSVAGVLVMCLILWPLTGHFGPQPAEWRLINPVEGPAGLVRNVLSVSEAFLVHLERLLRQAGVTWTFIFALALVALLRARALLAMPQALLLLGAVLLSFFVFSVPLAPLINHRSLVAMAAAVILFLAFLPGPSAAGRMLGVLVLLTMGYDFSLRHQNFLGIHKTETSYFHDKLQQLIPGHPMTYSALALQGTMDPARLEARTFNDPSRMHPIFITLRAQQYWDCRIEGRCNRVQEGRQLAALPFAGGELLFLVDDANVGIVRYREASGK